MNLFTWVHFLLAIHSWPFCNLFFRDGFSVISVNSHSVKEKPIFLRISLICFWIPYQQQKSKQTFYEFFLPRSVNKHGRQWGRPSYVHQLNVRLTARHLHLQPFEWPLQSQRCQWGKWIPVIIQQQFTSARDTGAGYDGRYGPSLHRTDITYCKYLSTSWLKLLQDTLIWGSKNGIKQSFLESFLSTHTFNYNY